MDWQNSAETTPSRFITEKDAKSLLGKPPATGAWRDGDPVGSRIFQPIGDLPLESGETLVNVRIAYEIFGELSPNKDNAILVLHALTGDSHLLGRPVNGHKTPGWWEGMVGAGKALDTNKYCIIAPNILGGCQGSTGPSSLAPDGSEWGSRFPKLSIRDQVLAQERFTHAIGITTWNAVVGGSLGGMHALEWGIMFPDRLDRLAVIAAPPSTTAEHIAQNSLQIDAIRSDPFFQGGDYYDSPDGNGPSRGLSLARRQAMLHYRSNVELNARFDRTAQSSINPLFGEGKYAVESYLDFHGNKFTRRFDANSYVCLAESMNTHDVARDRASLEVALATIHARTLVVGIESDRLFPLSGQKIIASGVSNSISGDCPIVLDSPYGHDGFLIENKVLSKHLTLLLSGQDFKS